MPAYIHRCTCIFASIKPGGCIAFPYLSGEVIQPPGFARFGVAVLPWKDCGVALPQNIHIFIYIYIYVMFADFGPYSVLAYK